MKKYLPERRRKIVEENKKKILDLFFKQSEEIDANCAKKPMAISMKWHKIKELAMEAGIKSDSGLSKILHALVKEGKLYHGGKTKLWIPMAVAVEEAQKNYRRQSI